MTNSTRNPLQVIGNLLLLLVAFGMVVPFLWMISTSLKADEYILSIPPQLLPAEPTLASYQRLNELFPIARLFSNSMLTALLSTLG